MLANIIMLMVRSAFIFESTYAGQDNSAHVLEMTNEAAAASDWLSYMLLKAKRPQWEMVSHSQLSL